MVAFNFFTKQCELTAIGMRLTISSGHVTQPRPFGNEVICVFPRIVGKKGHVAVEEKLARKKAQMQEVHSKLFFRKKGSSQILGNFRFILPGHLRFLRKENSDFS